MCVCDVMTSCPTFIRNLHNITTVTQHEAAVPLQSAYTLGGVGKWVFNQGHLEHLLLSPQPAFHPAPGERRDR